MSLAGARRRLTAAGLELRVRSRRTARVAAGTVISQSHRIGAGVEGWTDLDPEGRTERGIELMRAAVSPRAAAPPGGSGPRPGPEPGS